MPETVRIEGLRELETALAELPKATARNVLRRVLKQAAKPTAELAQSYAPRLTGKLQISIIVGTQLTRRQKRDRKEDGPAFAEVYVGTARAYGVPQEFGTHRMAAHPFMRPAWDATKQAALETVGRELGGEIEKAAARLARKAARG